MIKSTISKGVFFVLLVLFTVACKKKYEVKIISNYPDQLANVHAGPADFGTIAPGSTTGYKEISEGSNTLSGYDLSNPNIQLQGTVSMSGGGPKKHKGTLTINSDGTLGFVIEK